MNSKYLKSLRALKGFSQEEVANFLNISLQTYNKKENGKVPFLAIELKRLSDIFEIPMENFFESKVVKMNTKKTS